MNTPSLEPHDSAYRNFLRAVIFLIQGVLSIIKAGTELYVSARVLTAGAAPTLPVEPVHAPLARVELHDASADATIEVSELDRAAARQAARRLGLLVADTTGKPTLRKS